MANFGPLAAEIVSLVWGTPGNFNGFHVLSTLLQRRRSTEVNQTLHYVWPFPGLVRYIYTFGISGPLTEFCHVQNSLCVHVLRSSILAALLHGTQVVGVSQTYCEDMWRPTCCCLIRIFQFSICILSLRRYSPTKLCDGAQMATFAFCISGVEQRAPLTFGRAAITLGIRPHSRFVCYYCVPQIRLAIRQPSQTVMHYYRPIPYRIVIYLLRERVLYLILGTKHQHSVGYRSLNYAT